VIITKKHEKDDEFTRTPISVTLPKDCIEWLDKQIQNRVYFNYSHAVEVAILKVMKEEGKSDERK